MINLRKGTTEIVYFTGTEKATLTAPYFLFTFTNRTTGEIVQFGIEDTSTTGRYNKFSLVVNTRFSTSTDGFYTYSIREFTAARPQDYAIVGAVLGVVVETGYMFLRPATDFTPSEYSGQTNTFKTYNG